MKIGYIDILGIKISILNSYKQAYWVLVKITRGFLPLNYITVNNVHTVIEGARNKNFGNIINNSFLSLPDGKPLSIVARLKGEKNISRIFGPTFMEKTIDWGRKDNLKHFFFGSSEETLTKLKTAINLKYSGTSIVGAISPPFRDLTEEENNNYIQEMNQANPDIIWVGIVNYSN
jgi:N-acetylglucosaminyldiphosphoundecaprenol N-acetyl-beta-D-mannosaminyltransferase